MESQSDEQISTLTAFQYTVTYDPLIKSNVIQCFIKLSEADDVSTIKYTLTYLENNLNEIKESELFTGDTNLEENEDSFLTFKITCS